MGSQTKKKKVRVIDDSSLGVIEECFREGKPLPAAMLEVPKELEAKADAIVKRALGQTEDEVIEP